ncbi:MAG TPA: hypothetical protein VER03_14715, partial [Bryobacteraceae bacterium]|nr:hypothetical protein [Bryobacteraceae bacterium]
PWLTRQNEDETADGSNSGPGTVGPHETACNDAGDQAQGYTQQRQRIHRMPRNVGPGEKAGEESRDKKLLKRLVLDGIYLSPRMVSAFHMHKSIGQEGTDGYTLDTEIRTTYFRLLTELRTANIC